MKFLKGHPPTMKFLKGSGSVRLLAYGFLLFCLSRRRLGEIRFLRGVNDAEDSSSTSSIDGGGRGRVAIVDSLMYNGEPIVLSRIELLYPVVDRFYITESKVSHSGRSKRLYGEKNRHLFEPYQDKITWLVYDDPPKLRGRRKPSDVWKRENLQRNHALETIKKDVESGKLDRNFVVVNTDADEIPNPDVLREFQPNKSLHSNVTTQVHYLEMELFYYNCNWKAQGMWPMGHTIPGSRLINGTTTTLQTYRNKKKEKVMPHIKGAGWHMSYFFGVDDIIRKLESFTHQEFNEDRFKSREHILDSIRNGKDLYGREEREFDLIRVNSSERRKLPLPIRRLHDRVVRLQNVA